MAEETSEQPQAEVQETEVQDAPGAESEPADGQPQEEQPANAAETSDGDEGNEAGPEDEAGAESEGEPDELGDEPEEDEVAFSWQASEFVHHHKSFIWYTILGLGVAVLAILAIWLHLWLEIGVFVLMGAAVVVYARKPPRTLLYELSNKGVKIDGKLLPYSDFRSFGVIPDEEWHSIDLEPAKRFNPRTVLLFNQDDFEEIVGHLEIHLPRADREPDVIERISRYVRF